MKNLNERLKALRKSLNLTQKDFAEKRGIKRNTLAKYETGVISPSTAVVSLICRVFNVNEDWLRSGQGEMFLPTGDDVAEMVSNLVEESNPFYDTILDIMRSFSKLDNKSQEVICNFAEDLAKKFIEKEKKEDD